jgi:phage/plasmid-associated DNA primase
VSGESVQVAAKFKTAQTVEWKVPGALAGNEVPGWVDNSGSINRRIVLFDFPKRVHDGDMQLGQKLDLEMPRLLRKCNRAYLSAVKKHARDNIWKHLPAAFHTAKEELAESVNSLVHFLNSSHLEFDLEAYMPFEHFAAAYEAYVSSMGLQRMRLIGDKVVSPLTEKRCKVFKNESMRYPRDVPGAGMVTGRFVHGCDIARARCCGSSTMIPATMTMRDVDPLGDF